MANKAMCESTSEAKANRERVASDIGGTWHRQQESILGGVGVGDKMPPSVRTYDLPMVRGKYRRPSRLSDK